VVTRAELLAVGITVDEIRHRLQIGALIRVYRGVYRVGHAAASTEARYMAAVKACGEGSALCGRAAAFLLSLVTGSPPPPEVMATGRRSIEGINTRRARNIDRRDRMTFAGIPVTSVPRTLVDLAPVLSLDALALVCHEAGGKYQTTPRQVEAVLARHPTSPGAGKLRRVMRGEVHVSLSALERGFLDLLRANGLPLPRTNRRAGSKRVDCRWPGHRLTVELDSYRFHNSRRSWEQDRRREREAFARGDEFRRYTWGDVFEDPRLMLRELRALLVAASRCRGAPNGSTEGGDQG
jgi:hypothetical protein